MAWLPLHQGAGKGPACPLEIPLMNREPGCSLVRRPAWQRAEAREGEKNG